MVEVLNNFLFVKYRRIWFPTEMPKIGALDFVSLRQCGEDLEKELGSTEWVKIGFSTLHNNLCEDEGALFAKIAKNTKYEIKRAMKENVLVDKSDLNEFLPFFNSFAPTKNLKPLSLSNLKAYQDNLLVTKAYLDQKIFAMHAYVVDGNVAQSRARLLYSATVDRTLPNTDVNLVGRANRLLHWEDMLLFKSLGFCLYDWGGIAQDANNPATSGIDSFKSAYGGVVVGEPHYENKRLFLLKQILKKLKH